MGAVVTVKIVVPTSGGKDSQLCLQLAVEAVGAGSVRGLYNDTMFDHPETYRHLDYMRNMYGVQIDRVCAGSVADVCRKAGRFPGGGARHCTRDLKIKPSRKYYRQLSKEQGGFEVWIGVRAGESDARAERYSGRLNEEIYLPHEVFSDEPLYLANQGVRFRLPIVEWSTTEVFEALKGKENPLYRAGFDRVGCFPCLASGDGKKRQAFYYDEFGRGQLKIVRGLEKELGRSVWESNKSRVLAKNMDLFSDGPGCAMCHL
jgi:3'-phosphoadenosine 5'-phosphosulfate sulfotransferase (PAPS reductase)/FAD synthetase